MPSKTQSQGTCVQCGTGASKSAMLRHLTTCVATRGAGEQQVLQLRVDSSERPEYWLDLELRADVQLTKLDDFLRAIWLECCGHLSQFEVGTQLYSTVVDGEPFMRNEKSMRVRVDRAIGKLDTPFHYEYDYGSTTRLRLRVTARRGRPSRPDAVILLARNDAIARTCSSCESPAVSVCAYCVYEDEWFACEDHEEEHGECEDEGFHAVTNSPRMGVCAYSG